MLKKISKKGFTVLEVLIAIAVFLIFAIGVYSGVQMIFKVVYQSRLRILETALLSEQLEIVRNLPYESVGIIGGAPSGILAPTSTAVRNGINFDLTATVRNIDDSFDGLVGGTPNDISPADYKLVELSCVCENCSQSVPVTLSTIVAPKNLEGASQNGALFVNVFGSAGQPITGASVQVQGGTTTINDTTDNSGILRIIDIPTGTLKYSVTVTKSGHSQDQTYTQTLSNPTPSKLPITVISQTVSEIFLSIDLLGTLNLQTVNQGCTAIPNVGFSIHGTKIIGRDPDIFKYDNSFTTNGSGVKDFGNMEWDTYTLGMTGSSYDIIGSTPMNPFYLAPGSGQQVFLVLRPHTSNSLLVNVKDAGTGLPLSDANVRLSSGSYVENINTGLGYVRQTDWSGGSGQSSFVIENKYFADSGTVNVSTAGDMKLKKNGSRYYSSGDLQSSTFDLGANVNFSNIIWKSNLPSQCGVNPIKFRIATSASSSPSSWTFLGPDGGATSFYTATSTVIWSGHNGKRYLRYKVYLNTNNTNYTPTLSEVSFTFTNSCTPPGQSFFSGLSATTYDLEVYRSGYTTNSGQLEVSGRSETTVNLSPI